MTADKPRLLDLFCGAGGAAAGYHRAGFTVVGVDIKPQPHYPFEFHQWDALAVEIAPWNFGFDAIHASPPCQAYSTITPDHSAHPDLVGPTRELLQATGLPWVMENVMGAPLVPMVTLCGSMFGLRVRRHRQFESNVLLLQPTCQHRQQGQVLGVYGDGGAGYFPSPNRGGGIKAHQRDFATLMGMPWATPQEIVQAIPPAYTEYIGGQLLALVAA